MTMEIHSYDKYIVAFSGGKDSTALVLHLLDQGVPKSKIELWHHSIDGDEREEKFMDWPITRAYCEAFARAFNIPIFFSWKDGGFKKELLRQNELTSATYFENELNELVKVGGIRGKLNTRMKFPQVSPDLKVRWCSAYLKINIMSSAIRNQDRFNGIRTLILTGERGEESSAREKYNDFEPDFTDPKQKERALNPMVETKRHVDKWRPIKDWTEEMVWNIIERHMVRAHPAYYLGWSRVSCLFCIFGNASQFKSAVEICPEQGERVMKMEESLGFTIKRKGTIRELIETGKLYTGLTNQDLVKISKGNVYPLNIILNNDQKWELPAGAYGEGCGPS
jgi:3'-phosphoadenosine 5'-phosphosulfate sulfotransferase (PAPS reductase)/FAD synthetase